MIGKWSEDHICRVQNMFFAQLICCIKDAAITNMARIPICCAIWIQETYKATPAHTITLQGGAGPLHTCANSQGCEPPTPEDGGA